jgi:multisubunit Na+/H+ antiporter MnhB subunit
VLLGGVAFALVFGAFLLTFDIRSYIERNAASRVPGLSLDTNVAIAWAMAFFWGLVWPWILIAFYKRPLGRMMERLIAEVDAAAMKST